MSRISVCPANSYCRVGFSTGARRGVVSISIRVSFANATSRPGRRKFSSEPGGGKPVHSLSNRSLGLRPLARMLESGGRGLQEQFLRDVLLHAGSVQALKIGNEIIAAPI